MKLPELSHLQYAVIDCIGARKISGRELRERLEKFGVKKSGPGFYQLMARMEDSKFVEGEYTQKVVEGQIIKERVYQITGHGRKCFEAQANFYHPYGKLA